MTDHVYGAGPTVNDPRQQHCAARGGRLFLIMANKAVDLERNLGLISTVDVEGDAMITLSYKDARLS